MNIIPDKGERGFICGQTGSGKTGFAVWMLTFMPGTVIYDTKIEPKFLGLQNSAVCDNMRDCKKLMNDKKRNLDYIIVRPPVEVASDPDILDGYLKDHYEKFRNVNMYIDEAYQFHNQGRCGAGLISILTRGRSRGQTCILSSQRPAWLSRFCITESQRFYIFRLVDKADRKKLSEVIPGMTSAVLPDKWYFHYFDFDMEEPAYFSPVPLDNIVKTNYTDNAGEDRLLWV